VSQFEKQAGLSNGYFNQVSKRPSKDKIVAIKKAHPNLNIDWLIMGEGDMVNMSIKERTLIFIEHIGFSIKKFEEKCGLSNGYINSMKLGYGPSKLSQILSAFPQLNRDWLLYGEGDMLKQMPSSNISTDNDRITELEKRIAELQEDKKNLQAIIKNLQSQISILLEKI
jgi:hypothetical protein